MPSRDEIVELLRQAASEISPDGLDQRYDVFMERATQVENMRCETCVHLHGFDHCGYINDKVPRCFGCFHHKQKEPAG